MIESVKPELNSGIVIVHACSDWRLNRIAQEIYVTESAQGHDVVFLRTLGARMPPTLLGEIKEMNPERMYWLPHENCGAGDHVHNQIKSDIWPPSPMTDEILQMFGSILRDNGGQVVDRQIFDSRLYRSSRAILQRSLGQSKFKAEFVSLSKLEVKPSEAEKILIVSEDIRAPPSVLIAYAKGVLRGRKEEDFNMEDIKPYVIQAPNARMTERERGLAISALGIKEIISVPLGAIARAEIKPSPRRIIS
jgi:hypothetical protein